MSTDADDRSSRLSDALDAIFTSGRDADARTPTTSVDAEEPYELPEIVPATTESDAPRLPERHDLPATGPVAGADGSPDAPSATVPVTTAHTEVQPAVTPVPAPVATEPTRPATSWGDHMPPTTAATTASPSVSQLRTPGRRPRVRRVTRVLRHIDPWSTFKVALLFSAVGYVVALTSGVLLWRVADSTGTLDNVERWFTQFGWETFELKGDEIFHNAWIIGLFGVVASTGAAVLLVTLFNLVSDIVGGIRMTVLEEEVVERTISSTRRYVVRTPPTDATTGAAASATSWSVDDDGDPIADPSDEEHHDAHRTRTEVRRPAPDVAPAQTGGAHPTSASPTRPGSTADWSVD